MRTLNVTFTDREYSELAKIKNGNNKNNEIIDESELISQQIKKDKDDGSNVSLSRNTKQGQGQTNKVEHMPVDATHLSNLVDNQSAENHFMVEDDIIARNENDK